MIESYFSYLPPELLTKIFTYLPTEDLDNAFHVSQYWRNIATEVAKRRFNIRDNLRQSWLGKLPLWRLQEPVRLPKIDIISNKNFKGFDDTHILRCCQNRLVSATRNHVIKWDLSHSKSNQIEEKFDFINDIHADKYGVFVSSSINVTLIDIDQGSIKCFYPIKNNILSNVIYTSGTQLIIGNNFFIQNYLLVKDIETGKTIKTFFSGNSKIRFIRSDNENTLFSASNHGIDLWDIRCGNKINSILHEHDDVTGMTLFESKIINTWFNRGPEWFENYLTIWDWKAGNEQYEIRSNDRLDCPTVYNDQIFFYPYNYRFFSVFDLFSENIFSLNRTKNWKSMVIFDNKIIGAIGINSFGLEVIDLDPKSWGKTTQLSTDNENYCYKQKCFKNLKYELDIRYNQ